jgi:hypothetical protein
MRWNPSRTHRAALRVEEPEPRLAPAVVTGLEVDDVNYGGGPGRSLIDGPTQTANVSNTNLGTLGIVGIVGVDNLTLPAVNQPEVELRGGNSLSGALDLEALGAAFRGQAIFSFGNDTVLQANILVARDWMAQCAGNVFVQRYREAFSIQRGTRVLRQVVNPLAVAESFHPNRGSHEGILAPGHHHRVASRPAPTVLAHSSRPRGDPPSVRTWGDPGRTFHVVFQVGAGLSMSVLTDGVSAVLGAARHRS